MPKTDNLVGNKSAQPASKSGNKEQRPIDSSAIVPTNPPSLIESKEAKQLQTVKVPDFLKTSEMPETSPRQLTGYIGFAHPMSKNWPQMAAAGIEEGMPFLNHEGRFIPCKTLEFFLCRGESFKSVMNSAGKFIYATRDLKTTDIAGPIVGKSINPTTRQPFVYVPEGGKVIPDPHYITLLIVNLNGNLIPIKGDFRGTKSGGIEMCIRAVEAASTPDWGKLGEAHKVSMSFPQPFGRVYHQIKTKPGVGKASGRPYHTANSNSLPATIAQMQLLANAFEDEEFSEKLNAANENFDRRIAFMDELIANGPD